MRHVLIVDDEADIREVAQLSFELAEGWTVTTASSGAEGLERAAEQSPDVVLLDVMMPGLDGLATLERLRSDDATAEIPVVLLTAKVQTSDRARFESLPVSGVLAKPFDPITLPGELVRLLDS